MQEHFCICHHFKLASVIHTLTEKGKKAILVKNNLFNCGYALKYGEMYEEIICTGHIQSRLIIGFFVRGTVRVRNRNTFTSVSCPGQLRKYDLLDLVNPN